MVNPAGTDVCFTVTTFLPFNLLVCMGFLFCCLFVCFVVLHSRNAGFFLYLFCILPAVQVAISSAPKICLTELLCSCVPSHFQF